MARGLAAQRTLNDAFAQRSVHKRYVALVHGDCSAQTQWQTIDLPISVDWPNRPLRVIDPALGKPSITRWRCLSHDPSTQTSRIEMEPLTGRTHQLRVHLLAIGHPMQGDALYAPATVQTMQPRLMLHACELGFTHPAHGHAMQWTSPAPF
jgi:tRNA pseudouridine32 synthase/23S rRNA pseudouridine746 synthase